MRRLAFTTLPRLPGAARPRRTPWAALPPLAGLAPGGPGRRRNLDATHNLSGLTYSRCFASAPGGYFIGVTDRCMYSHTFHFAGAEPFTTGCTAVVEAKFYGNTLTPDDMLMDISLAQGLLRSAMGRYDHKNLDTLREFQEPRRNTTVEVVAQAVCKHLLQGLQDHRRASGMYSSSWLSNLTKIEVSVKESDVACAGFFQDIPSGFFDVE
mmetsp:Transcript_84055/g.213978  ORF Transcript_84055/g.213978 Transcript_84055/m.213978 type:complete len:210 (-) Transcript_84055:185-814(-)